MAEVKETCPRKHELPHKVKGVACTALGCGRDAGLDADVKEAPIPDDPDSRAAFVGPAPELEGQAATEFVDKEIDRNLPQAIKEMAFQLRHGKSSKERAEAAQWFLGNRGFGKREGGGSSVSPIVLVMNGQGAPSSIPLPWAKRAAGAVLPPTPIAQQLQPSQSEQLQAIHIPATILTEDDEDP